MKISAMFISMLAALLVSARAEDAPKSAPTIRHVPVTTAARGVPTKLVATVENHSGTITQSVALVRVTDLGVPTAQPLKPMSDGTSEAIVPVALVEGIESFWYSLTVSNDKGETTSTHWQQVRILENGFHGKQTALIGAGILAAGGAGLLIANNNDGGGHNNAPVPPVTNAPVKTVVKPCVLSGDEGVSYANLSTADHKDITILVCRTCPNATIRADATWGQSAELTKYDNWECNRGANYLLVLPKPPFRQPPPSGTYSIEVRSNGQLISTKSWPPPVAPVP